MTTEAPARRGPGRPARIDRDQVLRAALDLADRNGLEAVTMQRVARAVGAEPMSLYRHVRNKDDMLDGLVDIVFARIDVPTADEPWREAMRRRATSARQVLRRHPWALGLLESRSQPGPANLAHHEAVLANLFRAGFSPAAAVRAYNLVDSYVYGFALQEHTLPIADPDDLVEVAPEMLAQYAAGKYPNLAAVATELVASGFRYGDEFEPGLDLILEGLERQRRSRRAGRRASKARAAPA
jgi:AcrR family transcriptional regulator